MKKLFYLFTFLLVLLLCVSCDEDEDFYSPKPRGYMRLNLPEKKYQKFESSCPYRFEIPTYSKMTVYKRGDAQPCWYNLEFPSLKATIHLSYKQVNNNISNYIDTSHYFAKRHQSKATGIEETAIIRDSAKVYGLL